MLAGRLANDLPVNDLSFFSLCFFVRILTGCDLFSSLYSSHSPRV